MSLLTSHLPTDFSRYLSIHRLSFFLCHVFPFSPEPTHIGQFTVLLCYILQHAPRSVVGTACELVKGSWLQCFPLFSNCFLSFSSAVVFSDAYSHCTSVLKETHKPGFLTWLIWRRHATLLFGLLLNCNWLIMLLWGLCMITLEENNMFYNSKCHYCIETSVIK